MSTRRQDQVNELVRQELDLVIVRELDLPRGALITISRVDTSVDMASARVYVSIWPEESREKLWRILVAQRGLLQQNLNHHLVMQKVPQITLELDQSSERTDRLNHLLDLLGGS